MMSTIESRREFLRAVNSDANDFLSSVFGDDITPSTPAHTTEEFLPHHPIAPPTVGISAELNALGLESPQVQVLAAEFHRSLSPLTQHWLNLRPPSFDSSRVKELSSSYSATVRELFSSQVDELRRDFLAEVEDRIRERDAERDSEFGSEGEGSHSDLKCDDDNYGSFNDDDDAFVGSEDGEQGLELERYYMILERFFLSGVQHPSRELKALMAAEWGVPPRSIAVWFQNRRDRRDDDIMAEIDFTTRLNLGVEDEDDWSDEGEVPWDALENADEDSEVPDLPHIEAGAAPYRIPSLSHSIASESDADSSRFPSPIYTFGTPSPCLKPEVLPPTRPNSPNTQSRTSSVSSSFTFSAPTGPSQPSSGHNQPFPRMNFSSPEATPPPRVNIDEKCIQSAPQRLSPIPHTAPLLGTPRRGNAFSSVPPISPTSPPPSTSQPLSFNFSTAPSPSFTSVTQGTGLSQIPSSRAMTPALSISSVTSSASSPAAGPATPKAFSFSFGDTTRLGTPSGSPREPGIQEKADLLVVTPKAPIFEFDFGPPPIPSYDVHHDVHLTFGSPDPESMVPKDVAVALIAEEQPSESRETEMKGQSEDTQESKDMERAVPSTLLSMENDDSEAGRIIFFPTADDVFEEKYDGEDITSLHRPPNSFEDAVQLHFLAAAAALVDERERVEARQDVKEAIAAATIPLPDSPAPKLAPNSDSEEESLMGALPPVPPHARLEESKVEAHVSFPENPLARPTVHTASSREPLLPLPAGPAGTSLSIPRDAGIPPSDRLLTVPVEFSLPPRAMFRSPANVPPSSSPTSLAPLLLTPSEESVADIAPHSLSPEAFLSEEINSSCPPSPAPTDLPLLTNDPLAMSIITFPSASYSLEFKPVISQLAFPDAPHLDLSWSEYQIDPSKARELSPFEEFMPPYIDFQPPPPKFDPEIQGFLESFLRSWSDAGP